MSAFVDAERRLLTRVLNRLVPAEAGFPAAGDLGVAAFVEETVGRVPAARRLFLEGLGAIAAASHARCSQAFEDASEVDQDAALREVQAARPAFFDELLVHTYSGYYSRPEVIRLLGVEVWPPQPRGHLLDPFDPALLAAVRQRAPFYRSGP
jgi:gluconate 2-dehydrogenase subunit 3-like protein